MRREEEGGGCSGAGRRQRVAGAADGLRKVPALGATRAASLAAACDAARAKVPPPLPWPLRRLGLPSLFPFFSSPTTCPPPPSSRRPGPRAAERPSPRLPSHLRTRGGGGEGVEERPPQRPPATATGRPSSPPLPSSPPTGRQMHPIRAPTHALVSTSRLRRHSPLQTLGGFLKKHKRTRAHTHHNSTNTRTWGMLLHCPSLAALKVTEK